MADAEFTRPPTDPAAPASKVASSDSTVSRADPIGTGSEAEGYLADTPGGDVSENPSLDPLSRAESVFTQFPSLHGQPGVEIAERSSDVTSRTSKRHRKVFVVYTDGLDFDPADFDHAPNFNATRQYMLDHGLRPLGDVEFTGAEAYDARNTALTYEVEAVPAAVATSPETAHVVVSQD